MCKVTKLIVVKWKGTASIGILINTPVGVLFYLAGYWALSGWVSYLAANSYKAGSLYIIVVFSRNLQ